MKQGPFKTHTSGLPIPYQRYVWSRGPSKHTNQDFVYFINNMYEAGALQNTQIRTSHTISTICMKQGPFKTHKSGLPILNQQYVWSRGPSKHTNQDWYYITVEQHQRIHMNRKITFHGYGFLFDAKKNGELFDDKRAMTIPQSTVFQCNRICVKVKELPSVKIKSCSMCLTCCTTNYGQKNLSTNSSIFVDGKRLLNDSRGCDPPYIYGALALKITEFYIPYSRVITKTAESQECLSGQKSETFIMW